MEMRMARSPKTPTNEPTFSPERLQEIIAKAVSEAEARTRAAVLEEMKAAKSPNNWATGKSEASIRNEILVVKAFAKAGFGKVVPHQDVMTFSRWMAQGFRPVEGSESLKIRNLRLFHKSQVRKLTADELKAMKEQQSAAIKRHDAKVVPIGTSPQ
jgi:hypothetical protein